MTVPEGVQSFLMLSVDLPQMFEVGILFLLGSLDEKQTSALEGEQFFEHLGQFLLECLVECAAPFDGRKICAQRFLNDLDILAIATLLQNEEVSKLHRLHVGGSKDLPK